MLVRLLYVSRAKDGVGPEEIQSIVRTSKSHNPPQGITGVLCCTGNGLFVQVLEGGRAAVNQVYNKIVADPRHYDVQLLAYEETTERRFTGWSMGQVNLARANPSLLLKYSETTALDPYSMSGKVVLALFEELACTAAVVGP
ncbi:BLUF domain-containing protein [Azohydromonas aeria]|uniref:BLUF domain-containing protein n=1 Tax=Azohydromonas aeria TaxID=2590212 RepID=UPI0012F74224|nr:BLUF domain-containing protein [Azohydromonas aeria]